MMMKFSDGMTFDTSGELRLTHRSDGWYVVGKANGTGILCPVRDRDEGEELIAELKGGESMADSGKPAK